MIAQMKNAVKRINDVTYTVNSQSGSGSYTVNLNKIGFICSCPDHQYRGIKCKHIHAVEFSFAIILKGCQIYHNYMRPHEALDGKTPAEACGIEIEGDNKWLTLIQNASKKEI